MLTFLSRLDPTIEAAIIGSLTTVVASILGFIVLLWRLRREAQHAVAELKSAEIMKLKLRIYEHEVIKTVDKIIDADVALSGFLRRFEMDLTTHRVLSKQGISAAVPVARAPDLIGLKSTFSSAAVGIVTFVEQWLVVDPRFSIFHTAINAASFDITSAWGAYFDVAMRKMPVDLPAGTHWLPPDEASAAGVIAAGNALIDRLGTLVAYASDFRAEMQSHLIGPLFGNTVPKRQPIDPRYVVVALADSDILIRYFDASPWGQNKKNVEDAVRAKIRAG